MSSTKNRKLYNDLASSCAPDDFWSQVKRTVNGTPIGEDQVQLIVDAIADGLNLGEDDFVLDLCCGNGALSDRIFTCCKGGVGVDFAEGLIGIAQANFQRLPNCLYVASDVGRFVSEEQQTDRFTKAMCYGSFQLLSHTSARGVLSDVNRRFPAVKKFFIGNVPDKALMHDFYYAGAYVAGIEDDHESPIGIWRTEEEFTALAGDAGWSVRTLAWIRRITQLGTDSTPCLAARTDEAHAHR